MPFPQIFGFIIFLIAAFAETNRIPFDLPEAENELVAGFHTEYSSMKFACFFMAEYANMVNITCVATLLFLGGWHPLFPAPYSNWIPPLVFLLAAVLLFLPWSAAGARRGSHYASRFSALRSWCWRCCFAIPAFCNTYCVPFFWFAAKVGLPHLRIHLGARYAAALPLRPADAFRLDVPVPVRADQPVVDRALGRRLFPEES